MKITVYGIINLISYGGILAINFLANYIPIGGYNTGQVSAMYPNLFVPSGFTFSIWGIIFILLGFFAVQGFLPMKENVYALYKKITPFFVLSSIGIIAWIPLWHTLQIQWTLAAMILILVSLIVIHVFKSALALDSFFNSISINWSFSVFLGWISVATIANITAFLVNIKWQGFGLSQETWAIILILTAMVLGLLMILRHRDIAYNLVIIWAAIGITANQWNSVHTTVIYAAIFTQVVLSIVIMITLLKKKITS